MLYDTLADCIDSYCTALAHTIAQRGLDSHLPAYAGLTITAFAHMVEPTVAMISRYARTGNPEEFRDYTITLVEKRIAEGRNIEDVLALTETMYRVIIEMVAHEFGGDAHKDKSTRYIRRLESMRTFSMITIRATRSQHRKPN